MLLQQCGLDDRRKTGREQREDIMTLESALRVVQLNERGRQGRQRAKFMKEIRMQEERERRIMQKGACNSDPNTTTDTKRTPLCAAPSAHAHLSPSPHATAPHPVPLHTFRCELPWCGVPFSKGVAYHL